MNYHLRAHDDPILRQICEPVMPGDDLSFISYMRRIMRKHKGIGIAAPQIGAPKRVILVGDIAMINPEITGKGYRFTTAKEGCLSFPGVFVDVRRSALVKCKYIDEYMRDCTYTSCDELIARIVQHEIDHLDGICLVGGDE